MKKAQSNLAYLDKFTIRKVRDALDRELASIPDSLEAWIAGYLHFAIAGVRSEAVSQKTALHLRRFLDFFVEAYGHDRISTCVRRDVVAWQLSLTNRGLAPSTVNNHLASLSTFTTWLHTQAPDLFAAGDPAKGVGELGLPPLEPRALSAEQVRSLKNICDRLERFHQLKGHRQKKAHHHGDQDHQDPRYPQDSVDTRVITPISTAISTHTHGRPWRDRAIVYVLLSTGLRREELVKLDLDQLEPNAPEALRNARRARITRVKGKGKTERTVFLSADARAALADYLERERHLDAIHGGSPAGSPAVEPPSSSVRLTRATRSTATSIASSSNSNGSSSNGSGALFLSAASIAARAEDGRLSPQALNLILQQIGRWHDAELRDPARRISPLRPHDLRHTFAFQLAQVTGADAYELERRLGHRSQRYIQRYTNPPEALAAQYVEQF